MEGILGWNGGGFMELRGPKSSPRRMKNLWVLKLLDSGVFSKLFWSFYCSEGFSRDL
jgi:hypothetical protein